MRSGMRSPNAITWSHAISAFSTQLRRVSGLTPSLWPTLARVPRVQPACPVTRLLARHGMSYGRVTRRTRRVRARFHRCSYWCRTDLGSGGTYRAGKPAAAEGALRDWSPEGGSLKSAPDWSLLAKMTEEVKEAVSVRPVFSAAMKAWQDGKLGAALGEDTAGTLDPRPAVQDRKLRRLPTQRECRSGSRIRTGAGAVTIRRQVTASAGVGHASCSAGRRTTRTRQQSRNDLPG
jgi:hypothetical protein